MINPIINELIKILYIKVKDKVNNLNTKFLN